MHDYTQSVQHEIEEKLAATLRGSRPGVQSASPKTLKIQVFLGVTEPPGVAQPYILEDTARPRHITHVQV